MSSLARLASTISALRTPRERAWPTPMMLSPDESELTSPTTAQIFDVPTSRPTMTGDWSNMFLFDGLEGFGCGRERGAGFQPKHRRVVGDGQIECPDDLADFFAVIVNQPPVAQLVLDPVQGKGDLASLPRQDRQHLGPGDIHALQVHQTSHGRVFKGSDQPQRGADLRRRDGASWVQLGSPRTRQDREGFRVPPRRLPAGRRR